jgi:Domain of unknown function (DUF4406)
VKYYLAGPMSGYPQQNFPLFDRVANLLRDQGYEIVSPAELDSPEERAIALADQRSQQSWGDFLSRDVKIVADDVQGIIFLPGWEKSRDARLEATVGLLMGKDFHFLKWDDQFAMPQPMARMTVACTLHREFIQ